MGARKPRERQRRYRTSARRRVTHQAYSAAEPVSAIVGPVSLEEAAIHERAAVMAITPGRCARGVVVMNEAGKSVVLARLPARTFSSAGLERLSEALGAVVWGVGARCARCGRAGSVLHHAPLVRDFGA